MLIIGSVVVVGAAAVVVAMVATSASKGAAAASAVGAAVSYGSDSSRSHKQERKGESHISVPSAPPEIAMKDSLEDLLGSKKYHHAHVPDMEFKREITVCIYRDDDLSSFDERSKKLIISDE